jgi:tetratricopeptide (TPR) repeat protein
MARADRRRVRSKKPNAVSRTHRRDSDLVAIEDTLFFTRLRRHTKWMFVFLALAFGVGFVVFNVGGSGQGGGIGELLRDGGGASSGNISVSDAREQVQKNPGSAQAQRNLATALQGEGETDEAIVALERYVQLKPKDQTGLRELAGLHLGQGTRFAQEAQVAQVRAGYLTFGSTFGSPLKAGDKPAIGTDPIDEAVSTQASQAVNAAYSKAQLSYQQAEQTYEKLVAIAPGDPNIQLELAQAAQQSGNYPKAIAAYQKFLKLAPDDPSASIVKQQIAQLKAAQTAPSSG